jgi:hypothetical protein
MSYASHESTLPSSAEKRAAIKLAARQRVEAVWTCLDVLCPDLALEAKKVLAEKVLDLSRGENRKPPRKMITHCPQYTPHP